MDINNKHMEKVRLIILLSLSLIWSVNAQADIYSDFMELFYVYNPVGMEHHKKEGIQTICLYDCITDSLVENLSLNENWEYKLDSIGVYNVFLATESHGIEFILIKANEDYRVFNNIEPNRTKILRELIKISKLHPEIFTANAMNSIVNNIINPKGSWVSRQELSPLDTIGELKLYFDLKSIAPQ